ncbi:MAG: hypothetical protein JWO09_3198 [Bacteroidetes bacterium]|nr:hypothetical protein [Bacteroidota bacterium]
MKMLLKKTIVLILLLYASAAFPQQRMIAKADREYKAGKLQKAFRHYTWALACNRVLHHKGRTDYFYLLYQWAEINRQSNDTSGNGYQKIIKAYSKIGYPECTQLDKSIQQIVAAAHYTIGEYAWADDFYAEGITPGEPAPDRFRFGYAMCSLKQGRFGQTFQLLNEIKDSSVLEPEFSNCMQACRQGLGTSISAELGLNDTLRLGISYQGCYGGTSYRFDLVKRAADYEVIVYKERKLYSHSPWLIDFAKPLPDSLYEHVTAFEKELRNYQFTHKNWCTVSGDFTFVSPQGAYTLAMNGCAIFVGDELKKLLSERPH